MILTILMSMLTYAIQKVRFNPTYGSDVENFQDPSLQDNSKDFVI